jgi:thiol-disulfide isomerase/thioredoxin
MSTWTRRMLVAAAAGALALAFSFGAAAQDAPKNPVQNSSQDQSALADNSVQSDQATSLGDLARMARAKKQSEPKAVKVINDENLPKSGGGISIVGSSLDDRSAGPGGKSSSGGRNGKAVLLDFWASWCGPCRDSVPDLKRLQTAYGSDQLEVISVNEDKNENAGRNFVAQNGMNWEQRFDSGGEMARRYGVSAFPTFVLTDGNGAEVQRFVGEDPGGSLADRIGPYMKEAPQGTL